jgi:putative transposon-encoded protein
MTNVGDKKYINLLNLMKKNGVIEVCPGKIKPWGNSAGVCVHKPYCDHLAMVLVLKKKEVDI